MADVISKLATTLEEWSSQAGVAMPQDAPIGALPSEVVSQILLYSVSTLSGQAALHFILSSITFVCVDWRNIALNTPQLFSSIDLDIFRDQPDVFRFLLAHAGAVPLHLTADSECVERMEVASLLENYASRWASVALCTSSENLADLSHLEFPLLKNLSTVLNPPCVYRCVDFVAHAPQLRRLSICSLVQCDRESGYHTSFFLDVLRHCALRPSEKCPRPDNSTQWQPIVFYGKGWKRMKRRHSSLLPHSIVNVSPSLDQTCFASNGVDNVGSSLRLNQSLLLLLVAFGRLGCFRDAEGREYPPDGTTPPTLATFTIADTYQGERHVDRRCAGDALQSSKTDDVCRCTGGRCTKAM
ncbi:uncharacterized protein SCHCODRAFT_02491874 [Schizophyllum commune H4-8]|uniref:uncharacterized protein n=1 Tax=Schizophyllum commune (strain H4-8 / FGSC 9210) TaxID=578458 RepID=UPI0021608F4F|nr:uncharacterized protein SCHCODRAFT_02491874 [Schizophyllum commune H4-8]KAI5897270.1 hypothetical protein SCHCODRAFT_02491874 [Schizophyllum commune H4-8]